MHKTIIVVHFNRYTYNWIFILWSFQNFLSFFLSFFLYETRLEAFLTFRLFISIYLSIVATTLMLVDFWTFFTYFFASICLPLKLHVLRIHLLPQSLLVPPSRTPLRSIVLHGSSHRNTLTHYYSICRKQRKEFTKGWR